VDFGLFVHLCNFHAGVEGAALAFDSGFLHPRNMRLRPSDARVGQPASVLLREEKAPAQGPGLREEGTFTG
jgi:hypothetical protein